MQSRCDDHNVSSPTGILQALRIKWRRLVEQEKIHYNDNLLRTRTLDPGDGRLPFFLVFNEGRRTYIEQMAKNKTVDWCPFCSAEYRALMLQQMPALRILPNTYPCLPYQFVLCPDLHTGLVQSTHVMDATTFARETGFKVYFNAPGSGAAYPHLVFQASEKHATAPEMDVLSSLNEKLIAEADGLRAVVIRHSVFAIRVMGDDAVTSASVVSRLVQSWTGPINLLLAKNQAIIIPRSDVEVPSGFGSWKFGILEATGTFICQDDDTFRLLGYEKLHKALSEISLAERAAQIRMIELVAQCVS